MSKYDSLGAYLSAAPTAEVSLSFTEIEGILGCGLPRSAFVHRPWWANDAAHHPHSKAWIAAGYRSERVDMEGRRVVFRRESGININTHTVGLTSTVRSKYAPLGAYLCRQAVSELAMTFTEIEAVIGASLPPAAMVHAAWWSNNPTNNVMTKVWLAAGYRTERVNLASRKLVFRRADIAGVAPGAREDGAVFKPAPRTGVLARLRARLGGSVRVQEGYDLTGPTGETWDAAS